MKTYLECIPCFTRQALDAVKMVTEENDLRLRIMRRVLETASRFPDDTPPPAMGAKIHRIIREETGATDPYLEIKRRANRFALDRMDYFRRQVEESDQPFETALRLAIAGNIMDWGAKPHADVSEAGVQQTLEECLTEPLHGGEPEKLLENIRSAADVLYLADNAGEIVLDRLFIDTMPSADVTVAVKAFPAINDALMADAEEAGITSVAEVIETGTDTPGTLLEQCAPDFQDRFRSADLVISKGQGNYESLSARPENIAFLLKAKCPVVAEDIGCEMGDMILLNGGRTAGDS